MPPLSRAPEPGRSEGPGPWFTAGYGGGCSICGHPYEEGDEIRADGYGSWEGRECQDEHDSDHEVVT